MKHLFNGWRFRLAASVAAGSLLSVAICCWYRAGSAKPANAADLNDLIRERGSITFRSWDGKWIGSDCDTEIMFLPNEIAYLIEYQDAVDRFKGTYNIGPGGQITIRLDDLSQKWPIMVLERDSLSLRLRPKKRSLSFMNRDMREATIWDGQNSYWPFRPLAADEEALVKERLRKWFD